MCRILIKFEIDMIESSAKVKCQKQKIKLYFISTSTNTINTTTKITQLTTLLN